MEVFSTVGIKNENLISQLEERIIELSRYNGNPSSSLLLTFQALSSLNKGSEQTWKYLLEFFTYPKMLNRLDFFEITVKLIPALAIKTKNIFKIYTNISQDQSVNILNSNDLAYI